jgi:hypothetical protein
MPAAGWTSLKNVHCVSATDTCSRLFLLVQTRILEAFRSILPTHNLLWPSLRIRSGRSLDGYTKRSTIVFCFLVNGVLKRR